MGTVKITVLNVLPQRLIQYHNHVNTEQNDKNALAHAATLMRPHQSWRLWTRQLKSAVWSLVCSRRQLLSTLTILEVTVGLEIYLEI